MQRRKGGRDICIDIGCLQELFDNGGGALIDCKGHGSKSVKRPGGCIGPIIQEKSNNLHVPFSRSQVQSGMPICIFGRNIGSILQQLHHRFRLSTCGRDVELWRCISACDYGVVALHSR